MYDILTAFKNKFCLTAGFIMVVFQWVLSEAAAELKLYTQDVWHLKKEIRLFMT